LHSSHDLNRLIEELEDDNARRLLVTFTDPVGILSRALTAGENPDSVLDAWEGEATQVLDIFRKNRSRLALADRDSLLRHQDSYRVALANQAVLVPDALPAPDLPPGSLYNALATTLVAQNERVRRLLDELRASAIWPLDVPQAPMIDTETALAELADLKARAKDAKDLGATERRLEFVETTLTETRADLQKSEAALRASQAALEENRAELKIKSEQIGQLRKISENDAQLVSKLNADLQGAHDNQHALSQRIDELHAELDRVFNSKSWKVTEPLRGLRRLFSRGNSEGPE
jgi:DNA repair exonuclease SbcCD ATPase subunit